MKDIMGIPQIKQVNNFLLQGNDDKIQAIQHIEFERMEQQAGWNLNAIFYGLKRLMLAAEKNECLYPVYNAKEMKEDPEKKDVNIIHFPADNKSEVRPYIIICAGESYSSVCLIREAYPMAARFNDLGYHVFVLNYRLGGEGMFPKPMEDLAAAIQYIIRNEERLLDCNV
ncbi:MAG: alpha/beta hydrolase [Lachnospiraceae bacterium]